MNKETTTIIQEYAQAIQRGLIVSINFLHGNTIQLPENEAIKVVQDNPNGLFNMPIPTKTTIYEAIKSAYFRFQNNQEHFDHFMGRVYDLYKFKNDTPEINHIKNELLMNDDIWITDDMDFINNNPEFINKIIYQMETEPQVFKKIANEMSHYIVESFRNPNATNPTKFTMETYGRLSDADRLLDLMNDDENFLNHFVPDLSEYLYKYGIDAVWGKAERKGFKDNQEFKLKHNEYIAKYRSDLLIGTKNIHKQNSNDFQTFQIVNKELKLIDYDLIKNMLDNFKQKEGHSASDLYSILENTKEFNKDASLDFKNVLYMLEQKAIESDDIEEINKFAKIAKDYQYKLSEQFIDLAITSSALYTKVGHDGVPIFQLYAPIKYFYDTLNEYDCEWIKESIFELDTDKMLMNIVYTDIEKMSNNDYKMMQIRDSEWLLQMSRQHANGYYSNELKDKTLDFLEALPLKVRMMAIANNPKNIHGLPLTEAEMFLPIVMETFLDNPAILEEWIRNNSRYPQFIESAFNKLSDKYEQFEEIMNHFITHRMETNDKLDISIFKYIEPSLKNINLLHENDILKDLEIIRPEFSEKTQSVMVTLNPTYVKCIANPSSEVVSYALNAKPELLADPLFAIEHNMFSMILKNNPHIVKNAIMKDYKSGILYLEQQDRRTQQEYAELILKSFNVEMQKQGKTDEEIKIQKHIDFNSISLKHPLTQPQQEVKKPHLK